MLSERPVRAPQKIESTAHAHTRLISQKFADFLKHFTILFKSYGLGSAVSAGSPGPSEGC